MPGFYNVTSRYKGDLRFGKIILPPNETLSLYLNVNDEASIDANPNITKVHNPSIAAAVGTDAKMVYRDIDPNDFYEGGGDGEAITSVNGKTGVVVLDATDVGAKANTYVPAWSDVQSVPAALTTPQAAATPSIRAIGTSATQAAAGDHNHAISADANSGLASAANLQAAAVALSTRIRAFERPTIRVVTTSITLADSDANTIIRCENASDIVITIPNSLFEGFNVGILRYGAGNVALTPDSNATLRGGSLATIGAQYRMASIFVIRNSGGAAAEYKASETAN